MTTTRKPQPVTAWTKGLNERDKETVTELLSGNPLVLQRLKTIVSEWERELQADVSDYSSPAWAYQQAHNNGRKQELRRIKDLLNFIKD